VEAKVIRGSGHAAPVDGERGEGDEDREGGSVGHGQSTRQPSSSTASSVSYSVEGMASSVRPGSNLAACLPITPLLNP
jgi:hypothetical protein